jgi:hypothetical protein
MKFKLSKKTMANIVMVILIWILLVTGSVFLSPPAPLGSRQIGLFEGLKNLNSAEAIFDGKIESVNGTEVVIYPTRFYKAKFDFISKRSGFRSESSFGNIGLFVKEEDGCRGEFFERGKSYLFNANEEKMNNRSTAMEECIKYPLALRIWLSLSPLSWLPTGSFAHFVCMEGGGGIEWGIGGICKKYTNDGGKTCSDNSECESGCILSRKEYFDQKNNSEKQGRCYRFATLPRQYDSISHGQIETVDTCPDC